MCGCWHQHPGENEDMRLIKLRSSLCAFFPRGLTWGPGRSVSRTNEKIATDACKVQSTITKKYLGTCFLASLLTFIPNYLLTYLLNLLHTYLLTWILTCSHPLRALLVAVPSNFNRPPVKNAATVNSNYNANLDEYPLRRAIASTLGRRTVHVYTRFLLLLW